MASDDSEPAPDHDDTEDSPTASSNAADRRRAARIATFVAVPVTVGVALAAFAFVSSVNPDSKPDSVDIPKDSVEVDLPEISDADTEKTCRALVSSLPEKLNDLPPRRVSGDKGVSEVTAAWGEPPSVLRCGVDEVDVAKDARVYRLGAVCWLADEQKKETVWTTVDREDPVELRVPSEQKEPGQLAQAVSEPISEKVSAVESAPTGCSG